MISAISTLSAFHSAAQDNILPDSSKVSLYALNLFDSRDLTDRFAVNLVNAVDSTGAFERQRTVGDSVNY